MRKTPRFDIIKTQRQFTTRRPRYPQLVATLSCLGGLTNAVSAFRMALPYHGQRTQSVVLSHHHLRLGGAT